MLRVDRDQVPDLVVLALLVGEGEGAGHVLVVRDPEGEGELILPSGDLALPEPEDALLLAEPSVHDPLLFAKELVLLPLCEAVQSDDLHRRGTHFISWLGSVE